MIKGKKGCKENRDWKVRIFFSNEESYITVVEQVNEREARKVYESIKKEFEDSKTKTIEVDSETENETLLIHKAQVESIKLYRV